MNIAVATSIFAENKFDPFLTISYAEEKNISAVQFYMSENLQKDKSQIEKVRDLCAKKSIKMLCHSPLMLGNASADTTHCEALVSIFPDGADKYCIFHFDENCDVDLMVLDCKKLVEFGIIPCIENFYMDKSRHGLVANIEKFLAFFDRIHTQNISVLPVLDFPRMFIEQFTNFHPILLSELLIQKFARQKIIIHAIDSVSPQQKREDWCAIGRGIVGWIDIFDFIKKSGVFVENVVLEYESTDFIDESIAVLNKYKNMPLASK